MTGPPLIPFEQGMFVQERAVVEQAPQERRLLTRIEVDLPVQVQVVFPEATFTPVALLGRVCNLTLRGARIRLREVSEGHARKIILGPRFCRIYCKFPTNGDRSTKLFGRILNFNLHDSGGDGAYFLGVDFGENEESDLVALNEYLQSVQGQA